MNSHLYQIQISRFLTVFTTNVKLENQSGRYDINKLAESFLIPILNVVFKKEFERLEFTQVNYPAVDLRSRDGEICVQVTSEKGFDKIKETLASFISNKLYEKSHLIHLVIDDAYTTRKTDPDIAKVIDEEVKKLNLQDVPEIDFTTSNIWNIGTLLKEIEKNCSVAEQKKILDFLKSQYDDVLELNDTLIPYEVAFEAQLAQEASGLPFQFTNKFFGRDVEIASLQEFVSSDNGGAIAVVADGGYGKTRLCIEVFKTVVDPMSDAAAFVLNERAFQGQLNLGEYQSLKRVIILVDDAHRYPDTLSALFSAARQYKNVKLILTVRMAVYDDTVRLLPSHARNIPSITLKRLSYDETLNVIGTQVANVDANYKKKVAEESKGVPAVILTLCQILREGKHSFEISEEENFVRFVRELKKQIIDDLSAKYYLDPKSVNKIIELLSLLGPIKNSEDEIKEMAALGGITFEECSTILDFLEQYEFIQRKYLISILSDPYADVILLDMAPRIRFILEKSGVDKFLDRIIRNLVEVEHSGRLRIDVDRIILEFISSMSKNRLSNPEEIQKLNNNLETLRHFAYKKPRVVALAVRAILEATSENEKFWKQEAFSGFKESHDQLDQIISIVALNTSGTTGLSLVTELVREFVKRRSDFTLVTKVFRFREYDFLEFGYKPTVPCERQQFLIRKMGDWLRAGSISDFDAEFLLTAARAFLSVDFSIQEGYDRHKGTFTFGTAPVPDNELTKNIRDEAIKAIIALHEQTRGGVMGDQSFEVLLKVLSFMTIPVQPPRYALDQASQLDLVANFFIALMGNKPSVGERGKLHRYIEMFSRREVKENYKDLRTKLIAAANASTDRRERLELLLLRERAYKRQHLVEELKTLLAEYDSWSLFFIDAVMIAKHLEGQGRREFSDLFDFLISHEPQQSKELYEYVFKESPDLAPLFSPLISAHYRDRVYFYDRLEKLWNLDSEDARHFVVWLLTFGRNREKEQYDAKDLKYISAVIEEKNQKSMLGLSVALPDYIDVAPEPALKLCGRFIDQGNGDMSTEGLIEELFSINVFGAEMKEKLAQLAFDHILPLRVNSYYENLVLAFLDKTFGFDVVFSYLVSKVDYFDRNGKLYALELSNFGDPNLSQDQQEDRLLKAIEWFTSLEKPWEYSHGKLIEHFAVRGAFTKSFEKKLGALLEQCKNDQGRLEKLCQGLSVIDQRSDEFLDSLISVANAVAKFPQANADLLVTIFGTDFVFNQGMKSRSGPGPYVEDVVKRDQLTKVLAGQELEIAVKEVLELALKNVEASITNETERQVADW